MDTPQARTVCLALSQMASREGRTRPHRRWWAQVREESRRADGSSVHYEVSIWLSPTKREQKRDPSLRGSAVGVCHVTVSA